MFDVRTNGNDITGWNQKAKYTTNYQPVGVHAVEVRASAYVGIWLCIGETVNFSIRTYDSKLMCNVYSRRGGNDVDQSTMPC